MKLYYKAMQSENKCEEDSNYNNFKEPKHILQNDKMIKEVNKNIIYLFVYIFEK